LSDHEGNVHVRSFAWEHRDRCAISGIGQIGFSRASGRSELSFALEASLATISNAGLRPMVIDGIARCDIDRVRANDVGLTLTRLDCFGESDPGGFATCSQFAQAVGAISSGQATKVLVHRAHRGCRLGLSSGTIDIGVVLAAPMTTSSASRRLFASSGIGLVLVA
jgi:hypothetical protein